LSVVKNMRVRGLGAIAGVSLASCLVVGAVGAAAPAFAEEARTPSASEVGSEDVLSGRQPSVESEWYSRDGKEYAKFVVDVEAYRDRATDAPSKLKVTVTAKDLQGKSLLWGWSPNSSDVTLTADMMLLRNGITAASPAVKEEVRHKTDDDGSLTELSVTHVFDLYGVSGAYAVKITPAVLGGYWGGGAGGFTKGNIYPKTETLEVVLGKALGVPVGKTADTGPWAVGGGTPNKSETE